MKKTPQNSRAHGHWHAAATRMLAVACIPAGVLSHLALTDIAHGEPDARAEWLILQLTAMLVAALVVMTLHTLGMTTQALQEREHGMETDNMLKKKRQK